MTIKQIILLAVITLTIVITILTIFIILPLISTLPDDLYPNVDGNNDVSPFPTPSTNDPSSNTDEDIVMGRGNTSGNIANIGYIAQTYEWIYIVEARGLFPLYKMRHDESERQRVHPTEQGFTFINIIGDWIYYSNMSVNSGRNIYRLSVDGTIQEKINDEISTSLTVVDGYIYYRNMDDYLYRMQLNGTNIEKVIDEQTNTFCVAGDWIYYGIKGDYGFYKINVNGTERTRLSSDDIEIIVIYEEWVFFTVFDNDRRENLLHKMRMDGSERYQMCDDNIGFFNISDDWIYYSNWSDNEYLYRMNIDGTEKELIYTDRVAMIYILGDWVYYSSIIPLPPMYRVRIDGSGYESLLD
ncbi:MAG: DUF5050 domain-containing protein [Oscillospiraceae bacterium]|jgi:hypothetical protein|nr:DUF5050 domain-containing protein [Oscillospiraceae bacterium]